MKYLLDTNVISEMQKTNCHPLVKIFTSHVPLGEMALCTMTIGEICQGVEKLPPGKKKHELTIWLYSQLPEWFRGRIISLDYDCMIAWGRLCVQAGRTLPLFDSLIAAAALAHNLILVTRNTKDFKDIPILSLINPWEA